MFQTYWVGSLIAHSLAISLIGVGGMCLSAIAEPLDSISPINSLTQTPVNPSVNPIEDIPEEVLRTEIYTEARSPIDGKLLSAAEYIELDESLQATINNIPPRLLVSERLQKLIDLLKLRKLIRQVIPFF